MTLNDRLIEIQIAMQRLQELVNRTREEIDPRYESKSKSEQRRLKIQNEANNAEYPKYDPENIAMEDLDPRNER